MIKGILSTFHKTRAAYMQKPIKAHLVKLNNTAEKGDAFLAALFNNRAKRAKSANTMQNPIKNELAEPAPAKINAAAYPDAANIAEKASIAL